MSAVRKWTVTVTYNDGAEDYSLRRSERLIPGSDNSIKMCLGSIAHGLVGDLLADERRRLDPTHGWSPALKILFEEWRQLAESSYALPSYYDRPIQANEALRCLRIVAESEGVSWSVAVEGVNRAIRESRSKS